MLTNQFTTEEQLQFKFLESKKCPVHKRTVQITFPNGAPQIKNNYCRYGISTFYHINVKQPPQKGGYFCFQGKVYDYLPFKQV